jgi:hypothetical protein
MSYVKLLWRSYLFFSVGLSWLSLTTKQPEKKMQAPHFQAGLEPCPLKPVILVDELYKGKRQQHPQTTPGLPQCLTSAFLQALEPSQFTPNATPPHQTIPQTASSFTPLPQHQTIFEILSHQSRPKQTPRHNVFTRSFPPPNICSALSLICLSTLLPHSCFHSPNDAG